jgi:glycosyltransferase involved in cell wall biosynthesis
LQTPLRVVRERAMIDVSIIVPLYNEQDNVTQLCVATHAALERMRRTYELVLVDDGSSDATRDAAAAIAHADPRVRLVVLARNSGQTAAMAAGMAHARGKYLVTMDGDLQNDPRDIPLLVDTLEDDYDLVAGWRMKRQDKLVTRKIPSRAANWLIGKITGIPIRDNGCSLKAYRASVMRHVPLYSEMHRFIPAMSSIAGARIVEVPVRHHARQFGQSKYGLSRVYKVLLDLLSIKLVVTYANRPLVWFCKMALAPAALAAAFMIAGVTLALEGTYSLPLFGSGLVLALAVGFLIALGSLAELAKHFARRDVVPLVTASARYSKPASPTIDRGTPI